MLKTIQNASTHDLVRWLVYLLIALNGLIYSVSFDSVYTTPKLLALRLITLAIIVVWGVQILALKKITYRRSPINKWLFGYSVVLILVTLSSTYPWVSLFGIQGRFLGLFAMLNLLFLTFLVMNFFQNKQEVRHLVEISVWTAIAVAIFGWMQYTGIIGGLSEWETSKQVFGTLGNQSHFGAYLAFHLMLLVGLFLTAKRGSVQAVYGVAGLVMLAAILATGSRGVFLAVLGATFVFLVSWANHHADWFAKERKKISVGLVTFIVLSVIFYTPLMNGIKEMKLTKNIVGTIEYMVEGNVPERVSWWYTALDMFKDEPVLGHGLSTFRDVYNGYRRLDYRNTSNTQDTITPETAHMEYFNIAATQGLVGLLFYLGIVLVWIRLVLMTIQTKKVSMNYRLIALSFLTAGLVYLIQVLMSYGVVGTLVPLYIVIGLGTALYHIEAAPVSQSGQFKTINLNDCSRSIGAVVAVLLILIGMWVIYQQVAAEWHLEKADQALAAGEYELMLKEYEKTTEFMPHMYTYWVEYGANVFKYSTYDDSIDLTRIGELLEVSIMAYDRAYQLIQSQPHIPANYAMSLFAYADVLEAQGEKGTADELRMEAIELYDEAVNVAVNNPLYPYNFGKLLMEANQPERAFTAFHDVLKIREPYKETYYWIAYAATELGHYDDARAYIQSALVENPSNQNVKNLLQRINRETTELIEDAETLTPTP